MVWATTMIGIKHNSKKEEQAFLIPLIKQIDKKNDFCNNLNEKTSKFY